MPEKKSDDYYVDVPEGVTKKEMLDLVEKAAVQAGLYISHIGRYSHKKYPNSVHSVVESLHNLMGHVSQ